MDEGSIGGSLVGRLTPPSTIGGKFVFIYQALSDFIGTGLAAWNHD
jgi:hypothetical protein